MNTWVKRLGAIVLAGSLLVAGSFYAGSLRGEDKVAADTPQQQNRVTVVGKGELSVKPDIVYLSIGVETYAETAKAAQKSNAQKMEKVQGVLKNTWKIDEKDIKTERFYVQPNYTYSEKEGQKVKNYSAFHSLEVTMRDLDKVGDLLDAASNAGANQIGGARFSVENRDIHEAQVIEKAMASADMKAQAVAKGAKRQLGIVVNAVQAEAANNNMPWAVEESANNSLAKMSDSSTSVNPGEIKLVTEMYVQYELK